MKEESLPTQEKSKKSSVKHVSHLNRKYIIISNKNGIILFFPLSLFHVLQCCTFWLSSYSIPLPLQPEVLPHPGPELGVEHHLDHVHHHQPEREPGERGGPRLEPPRHLLGAAVKVLVAGHLMHGIRWSFDFTFFYVTFINWSFQDQDWDPFCKKTV